MKKRRKTARERKAEQHEKERQGWESFKLELSSLKSRADVEYFIRRRNPQKAPAERWFSNLGYFIATRTAPQSASSEERHEYDKLVDRLTAAGEWPPAQG